MATHAVSDLARLKFLRALGRSGLPMTAWEQGFLAEFRHSSRPSLWFTHRRRLVADRMRRTYSHMTAPCSSVAPMPDSSRAHIAG